MAESKTPIVGKARAEFFLVEFQGSEDSPFLGMVRAEDINFDPVTVISATANGILAARARHPDMTLAQMYDEATMPPDLREAHRLNDMAVCQAYCLPADATEQQIVEALMERYRELTDAKKSAKQE